MKIGTYVWRYFGNARNKHTGLVRTTQPPNTRAIGDLQWLQKSFQLLASSSSLSSSSTTITTPEKAIASLTTTNRVPPLFNSCHWDLREIDPAINEGICLTSKSLVRMNVNSELSCVAKGCYTTTDYVFCERWKTRDRIRVNDMSVPSGVKDLSWTFYMKRLQWSARGESNLGHIRKIGRVLRRYIRLSTVTGVIVMTSCSIQAQ